jgi:hypothetical protein
VAATLAWLTRRIPRYGALGELPLPGPRFVLVRHEGGTHDPPPEGRPHRPRPVSWLPGRRRRRSEEVDPPAAPPRDRASGFQNAGTAQGKTGIRTAADESGRHTDDPHEPGDQETGGKVVQFTARSRIQPREWNLWDLESASRRSRADHARAEERRYLLVHLRQFARADGSLPAEFDGLIREAFSDVLQPLEPT